MKPESDPLVRAYFFFPLVLIFGNFLTRVLFFPMQLNMLMTLQEAANYSSKESDSSVRNAETMACKTSTI